MISEIPLFSRITKISRGYRGEAGLAAIAFLLTFFFIRIYDAPNIFMLPRGGDDGGYFAFTEALFKVGNLNWCDPRFSNSDFSLACQTGQAFNRYTPGPALLLLPFNTFGFFLDRIGLFHPSIDALLFWTVVGTFFLLLGGVLFLYRFSLAVLSNENLAFATTAFFVIGNAMLYYVFRRPLMAHAAEFFVFNAGAYLTLLVCRNPSSRILIFLLGLACGTLAIVRLNDAYLIGTALILLFAAGNATIRERAIRSVLFFAGLAPPILLYLAMFFLQKHGLPTPGNYDATSGTNILLQFHLYSLRRIFDFYFGPHWGSFFLMPILFFEFYFIARALRRLGPISRKRVALGTVLSLLFLFKLFTMSNYPSNGMSYGLRYLFTENYAFHCIFILALAKLGTDFTKSKSAIAICGALVALGAFNLINFESNSSTLTLTEHPTREEGIYTPYWGDKVSLCAPNYAFYSLENTMRGKAFVNLVASPMAAYLLFLVDQTPLARIGAIQTALGYYRSSKRAVYRLTDLDTLMEYQGCVLVLLLLGFTAVCLLGKPKG